MNRRQLFRMLPLAGIAVALPGIPEGLAYEIKPEKKYLFNFPHRISQERLHNFARCLRLAGFRNGVVTSGEFDIYEVESEKKTLTNVSG